MLLCDYVFESEINHNLNLKTNNSNETVSFEILEYPFNIKYPSWSEYLLTLWVILFAFDEFTQVI